MGTPIRIKLNDARTIDAASGHPVTDATRMGHQIDPSIAEEIIEEASKQGVDPHTALAVALQETGADWDENNPFHIDHGALDTDDQNEFKNNPLSFSIGFLKQKLDYGKKLGKTDEASILQAYNGYGKVGTKTEGSYYNNKPNQQFYGIDVSNAPLDMNVNPVYGKRVIDIRDNILKKSPQINRIVAQYPIQQQTTTDPKYAAQPVLTGFAEGGIANTGEPQANQNVPDSHFVDNSQPAPTNTPFQQVVQRAQNEYKEKVDKGVHPDKAQKEANDFIRLQSKNFVNRADDVIPIDKEIERTPESALTEFGKSIYNGFLPPVIKLIPDIASIATNAVGLHSDIIDNFSDDVSKWVDKNATAWINPEHNQGIFKQNEDGSWGLTDAKSMINGLGQGMGTIANFAALAYLTGGAGDVTEAVELINAAKLTGDAIGLAKATTMLKSAQASLTATKWISGSLVFMPQIWEDGKKAGLDPTDNARMTMALGVALGGMGTISGVEKGALEKFATRGAISEIEDGAATNLSDKGILRGLEGLPKGVKLSENEFKTAFKATMSDASSIAKRVIGGNVPKAAVKEFGQMYLQSAVQTSGEQMYDVMFADGKEPGKGAYGAQQVVGENDKDGIGPSVFGYRMGKRAFMNDLQSGIYGGILGAGMASYHNPIVNQSLYGYLDSKIRDGKAEEGVGKVKKMAEVLLKKGKLDPQRYAELVGTPEVPESQGQDGQVVPAQPAKKGLIDQMAETAQGLKGVNSDNLTPAASYDAYNYQYNERPKYDAKVQKFEDVKTALAQTLSEPANQNPATADVTKIASLQKMVAEGYKDYRNNVESVHEINKHVANIAATGKMSDIGRKLSEIKSQKHDWTSDEQLKPLMQGYDAKPHAEVMKEQGADKNGVRHKDLVGEQVTHVPTGRKGTIAKEMDDTHVFQPHADETDQSTVNVGSGEDVVDRSQFDHNLTSPKEEQDVQVNSTEEVAQGEQARTIQGVSEGQSEGDKTPETREIPAEEKVTEEPTDHFLDELKSVKPDISPEEVKKDESAVEEVKPELEAESESDPKVKEVFEEAGKRIIDLDERARKQRETKAAKQEIKFKERKELLAAEPSTPEEMILQYFVEGNKIHTDDLKAEVANSGTDFNKLIWSHSKSSPTLDKLIEQFQERWQHEHGAELDYTDLRNEIIGALTGHDTKWSMEEALRTAFADSNGTVVQGKVERAQVRHNEEEARHAEGLEKQSKAKLESLKAELEIAKYAWEKAKSRLEKNGQQDQIDIFGKKPADESLFRNDIKEQESIVAEKKAEFDRLQKEVNNFEEQLPNQKDMFVDKAKEHLDELLSKKEMEDDGCPF